jgi:hypothetical protein
MGFNSGFKGLIWFFVCSNFLQWGKSVYGFEGFILVTIQGEHKSFPDYKHLLQENYVEYKHYFFQNETQLKKFFLETNWSNGKKNMFVFHVVFL